MPYTNTMLRPASLAMPSQPASIQAAPLPQKRSRIDEWMLKRAKPIAFPAATELLTRMTMQIMRANGLNLPFKVHVVSKPHYNASASANGTIMFHLDTLKRVSSPEELAFVLAHEISHLQNKDGNRRRKRGFGAGFVAGVSSLWVRQLFRIKGFLPGSLVDLLAFIIPFQWFAAGTRKDEARADVNAIHLLRNAGMSPLGYRAAFANMAADVDRASWFVKANWKIFGEDHPKVPVRNATLDQLIQGQPISYAKPILSQMEWQRLKQMASGYVEPKKSSFSERMMSILPGS